MSELSFTGEYFVPGQSGARIEADHRERYDFASRYAKGSHVLDIACGTGYGGEILTNAGAESYCGVDINEGVVQYAQSTYGNQQRSYQVGDITKFSSEKKFDLITCFETIEHVADYTAAISNLAKLAAPGGKLVISSPNRPVTTPNAIDLTSKPSNRYHTQEFVPQELAELLEKAGFSVQADEHFGQRGSVFHASIFNSWQPVRAVVRKFIRPDHIASPKVRPIGSLPPRYFLLCATRNGSAE